MNNSEKKAREKRERFSNVMEAIEYIISTIIPQYESLMHKNAEQSQIITEADREINNLTVALADAQDQLDRAVIKNITDKLDVVMSMGWYGKKYILPNLYGEQLYQLERLVYVDEELSKTKDQAAYQIISKERIIILSILKQQELAIIKGTRQ